MRERFLFSSAFYQNRFLFIIIALCFLNTGQAKQYMRGSGASYTGYSSPPPTHGSTPIFTAGGATSTTGDTTTTTAVPGVFPISFGYRVIASSVNNQWSLDIADIDGDGDNDILVAPQVGSMAWLENTSGNGSAWSEHVVQGNGINGDDHWWASWSVFAKDMDGDGDLDVVGGTGRFPPDVGRAVNEVNWWENVGGKGLSWVRHIVDVENRSIVPPWIIVLYWAQPADLDGDGDMDIAVANYDSIISYTNEGGTFTRNILDKRFPGAHAAHPADLTGRGGISGMSIIGASYYAGNPDFPFHIKSFLNGGPSDTALPRAAWSVFAFDGDDDGDLDVVAQGVEVRYWENGGDWQTVDENGSVYYSIQAADLDGDGDEDIAGAGPAATTVWTNDGLGRNWTRFSIKPCPGLGFLRLGDIDGDGDIDVVGIVDHYGAASKLVWCGNKEESVVFDPSGQYHPGSP